MLAGETFLRFLPYCLFLAVESRSGNIAHNNGRQSERHKLSHAVMRGLEELAIHQVPCQSLRTCWGQGVQQKREIGDAADLRQQDTPFIRCLAAPGAHLATETAAASSAPVRKLCRRSSI